MLALCYSYISFEVYLMAHLSNHTPDSRDLKDGMWSAYNNKYM
jgi:hypothetical protein